MEGIAGCRLAPDPSPAVPSEDDYYRSLLQEEVNAVIDSARASGTTGLLVHDSHGQVTNFRSDALAARARYLPVGTNPSTEPGALVLRSLFFVSYHNSMAGAPATLSRTHRSASSCSTAQAPRKRDQRLGDTGPTVYRSC
ncbi:M55 family metallopeptidase [Streptomyces sp. P9-2B-2]|uniref:M55 family metallopeptidase n=1 Tax=Streptomyces sp. P9-2B-2 TaxID=3057114 RepID=UPI0033B8262F